MSRPRQPRHMQEPWHAESDVLAQLLFCSVMHASVKGLSVTTSRKQMQATSLLSQPSVASLVNNAWALLLMQAQTDWPSGIAQDRKCKSLEGHCRAQQNVWLMHACTCHSLCHSLASTARRGHAACPSCKCQLMCSCAGIDRLVIYMAPPHIRAQIAETLAQLHVCSMMVKRVSCRPCLERNPRPCGLPTR